MPLPDPKLLRTLRALAPGTPLREGLDNILRARTGALLVLGNGPEVMGLVDGGFRVDVEVTPAILYELAKMDGAIVLTSDAARISHANVHLVPDPDLPSAEAGIRHRSAERVSRQAGVSVVAISQRRNVITLYQGPLRYVLQDLPLILGKANQALQTLEKYRAALNQVLANLTALEFEDLATPGDVVAAVQRLEMVRRVVEEVELYVVELGTEGRLVGLQLRELSYDLDSQRHLLLRDYLPDADPERAREVASTLGALPADALNDAAGLARLLGFGSSLEATTASRGLRVLHRVPRLPGSVIENLSQRFSSLAAITQASLAELDGVEGIGEVRAKAIREGLRRVRDQAAVERSY